MSASMSSTLAAGPRASAAARLIDVSVLPSLEPGLVIATTRTPRVCCSRSTWSLRFWYCSAANVPGGTRPAPVCVPIGCARISSPR